MTIAACLVLAMFMMAKTNTPVNSNVEHMKSIVAELKDIIDNHQTSINAQDATIASLTKKTESLENELTKRNENTDDPSTINEEVSRRLQGFPDLSCISRESSHTDLIFSGCNVHIRNGNRNAKGERSTSSTNRRGNLIVGYNEGYPGQKTKNREGSHNIVMGMHSSYSSFSGIVAGYANSLEVPFAIVRGGSQNVVDGWHSSIWGGARNRAGGAYASILGGWKNNRSARYATAWDSVFKEWR
eukprot:CAMPEP_0195512100 /NCGR_PEP_ID=MMETSP0794_2-20130614/4184_1 /TAXON_ID=515487 /ORGANISM="Stephanopyxis turris, Strain CCMP 815" /LENGTH=242 /DNA_ID=CAMNT_0040639823 /DNA_START=131 /DNA_END=859 /DNA_ORIENTATION=-